MARVKGEMSTSVGYVTVDGDNAADFITAVNTIKAEFGVSKPSANQFDKGEVNG